MNRNLRSNRAKKEQILKKDQVILCKVETEFTLYKLLQDWNENEEEFHVTELVPFEKKKKNKQQYKCNGYTTIPSQTKWVDIEGISVIHSDETIYVVDMEIYKQSQRSLIKDLKQKVKQSQKKYDDDEDEDNDRPIKKKPRKSAQQKTQVETQFSQYEEESSEQSSSAEAEPVPKKQRQSRKTEEKEKKKGKKRKRKLNENLKNLKSFSTQFEGTEDNFIDYDSTRMNNKEIIRAAITGNKALLEEILFGDHRISNLYDRWGPEYDISILDILFRRQDKQLLTHFLQNQLKRGIKYYSDLPCQLKEIDTGYNNRQAYGVKLRKVALGRGNREGNNAFVYDLNYQYDSNQESRRLLQIETNCEMYEQLFIYLKSSKYDHYLIENVAFAVRCGNIKSAKFLIKYALTNNLDGYGFNYLHHDALDDNFSTYKLDQIKKISITKKTQNEFLITPIHCACINPSEQFLKYFMEQTMEYNIQDENGSKPVHYAAVSQTSNCLEYLLANGVDSREGNKFLETPLMLAAKFGRSHNVKLKQLKK